MEHDIRWKQRFQNYESAMSLLREAIARGIEDMSDLEKAGAIQRFEFSFELAWKTLKDYLEREGTVLELVTARGVLKEAFRARILSDGQVWIDMLDHRNLLSHTYDEHLFESALAAIRDRYLPRMDELYAWFKGRLEEQ
jgi:nucleotidyltransferase substrate binding protein (TIGR01987 family)